MGDAHQVVVHHVCEVIGGQAVPLDQHLVVQGAVFHRDVAKDLVMEGGAALVGDALADHIGLPLGGKPVRFLPAHAAAGIVPPVKLAAVLLALGLFAEAAVGMAPLHQQLGIFLVKRPPLRLHIGGHRAAHIRAFIVLQVALGHSLIDHIHGALHQAALVRILNAEDELAAGVPGDEIGIERGAQVANVHISSGGRREAGAHFAGGNLLLHGFKPAHVFHINASKSSYSQQTYIILYFTCCQAGLNLVQ